MESLVLCKEVVIRRGGAERGEASAYFIVLHKVYEGCALNLHGLPLPVVKRQDEVKEVGFPQVGGRLLLKVGTGQGDSAAQEETRGHRTRGRRKRHAVTNVPTQHCRGQGPMSWVKSSGPFGPFFNLD